MAGINLFAPETGSTVTITCSQSSQNIPLGNNPNSTTVRVKNLDTTNVVFIEIGTKNTQTATVPNGATPGSMPIGPGETAGFSIPVVPVFMAAISSAGTPLICFTPGSGA